jgi:hypothetical protein
MQTNNSLGLLDDTESELLHLKLDHNSFIFQEMIG